MPQSEVVVQFLGSFAPVMAEAATSQPTAAVPAMAPGAARLSLSRFHRSLVRM